MNRTGMLIKSLSISILSLIIMAGCSKNEMKESAEEEAQPDTKPALHLANMDTLVKPGDNFYKYVNGKWLEKTPVPEEYSRYGVFNELQDDNYEALRSIFEAAAADKNAKQGSMNQKIGDFYATGMDVEKINKDGINPLNKDLKAIDNLKSKDELLKYVAHMHKMGVFPMFIIFADQDEKNSEMVIGMLNQGGLGLPDRDYYLNDDSRSKDIRTAYMDHLKKMFSLMGYEEPLAVKASETIMNIETELAKNSRTRLELRDPNKNYNKMSLEELRKIAPEIKWPEYFKDLGIENPGDINVRQPEFFKGLSDIIAKTSLDDWKTYLKWNLLNEAAAYLSKDFDEQNFHFYGMILTGQQKQRPRWKRVLGTTSSALGELVGKLYVEKYFPPEAKKRMLDMVKNLKLSLQERIQNLSWMTEPTKEKAIEKLTKMRVKIGYPDKWRDYSGLEIKRDSYIQNVMRARAFNMAYELNKIGKPVDKDEWHMNPQTINAYYNPSMNEIVFPAAILQPPFFNMYADDAVNYGAIGTIIGHEMTHGFDDQGRLYDVNGNLSNWWTPKDSAMFVQKTKVLVDQYDKYNVKMKDTTVYLNGALTLGENIADFGGITISLNAFKKTPEGQHLDEKYEGLTNLQRFFISYGQIWKQVIRPEELMKRVKEDVHSLGRFRVNGVVRNVPEFYQAFNVTQDEPLFLKENQRAVIW